jgi:2-octaprenyl-6-methoxyphenol hydroxylase
VENAGLVEHLGRAAREAGIRHVPEFAEGFEAEGDAAAVALADGTRLTAALVVAADGRNSRLRAGTEIRPKTWSYPQTALTTILAHDREHGDASTEFHTRHGPFTLVPLPGRRSSLVWVTSPRDAESLNALDDAALGRAVERQAQSMLGRMRVDGPRGLVPMSGMSVDRFTAARLALVGEAAHVFPPIGAQGLEPGLRDAAALRDAVADALAESADIGSEAALGPYQRGRALDVRLRTAAVDGLNRTLLSGLLPADFLRGLGLVALGHLGPLRRAVMREGVLPRVGAPRLMRAG